MGDTEGGFKGLCGTRLWPVLANDGHSYQAGAMSLIPGALALKSSAKRREYVLEADDEPYKAFSEYLRDELILTVNSLPLEIAAALGGSEYDGQAGLYTFREADDAPEFAFGYAALLLSGQYRMYKYYALKLTDIRQEHKARGIKDSDQPLRLTLSCSGRKTDGAARTVRDSTDGTYAWLDRL